MPVTVDGRTTEVEPAELGLSVDYAATVAEAGARKSWSPTWLWSYATGGDEVDPVIDVDQDVLADYLATAGDGLGTEPVDGAIVFRKGEAVVTDPVVGQGLDDAAARAALVAAYLTDGRGGAAAGRGGPGHRRRRHRHGHRGVRHPGHVRRR